MKRGRKIELLSPAKNLETGIAAIDHGADAVYIGADRYGARAAAGNTVDDIKALADYAHQYHAWVYVTLNTLIYDNEIAEVEQLIRELYKAGVDALIVQDMGILEMDLPSIELHASTQTDNRTVEKVQFLEQAGFNQVVLARELSLQQIKAIAQQSHVRLETFVHGALCTSYSGQCYISQALAGRSANRGECAQYCRLPYTLHDSTGKVLASNKHLLSLKDLNLSVQLEDLLDAGVSSLKIEGRLKDTSYVKNITAYYRQKLDEIFSRRPEYQRASSGETTPFFIPNPEKSFNRGFTTYFLNGRNKGIASPDTPKSLGEPVGNVRDIHGNYFTLQGKKAIHNGDGLCFINPNKELQGFRVNRVEDGNIYPAEMPRLEKGATLYRNFNQEFDRILTGKSAERKIGVTYTLEENNFGFTLSLEDEDGYRASVTIELKKEKAQKPQNENIRTQLAKLGNTPFRLDDLNIKLSDDWFIPSSVLGELRRKSVQAITSVRKIALSKPIKPVQPTDHSFPEKSLDYRGNVTNTKAQQFYERHGVGDITPAFELQAPSDVPVMTTKHCIKYQLGYCPKEKESLQGLNEPLTLTTGNKRLRLKFDCGKCEMEVI